MPRSPEIQRAASKRHYEANKQYYRAKNNRARQRKIEYMRKLKEIPCADCGIQYEHYKMEFDHLEHKFRAVSSLCGGSWKQLYAEIAKCEIVCCNCHAERTWYRKNNLPM